MVFLIPILGLFAGILLGSIISIQIPLVMAKYCNVVQRAYYVSSGIYLGYNAE